MRRTLQYAVGLSLVGFGLYGCGPILSAMVDPGIAQTTAGAASAAPVDMMDSVMGMGETSLYALGPVGILGAMGIRWFRRLRAAKNAAGTGNTLAGSPSQGQSAGPLDSYTLNIYCDSMKLELTKEK